MNGTKTKWGAAAAIALAALLPLLAYGQESRSGAQRTGRGGQTTTTPASRTPANAAQDREVPPHVSEKLEEAYARMEREAPQPVAKREYKVETTEARKTKLFRADPKLLENKFVASAELSTEQANRKMFDGSSASRGLGGIEIGDINRRLFFPGQMSEPHDMSGPHYPDDLRQLIVWGGKILFSPNYNSGMQTGFVISEQNKLFLEHCKEQDRPEDRIAAFLTSADCDRDVHRANFNGRWIYHVYAPTAEETEARAAGLLKLLDGGLSKPMQRWFVAEGKKPLEAARKTFADIAEESTKIERVRAKLAEPSEISAEILSQLKAQKVMVAIELSGLSARVKACDEMLKDVKNLPPSTLQSVSDMKVKADIERVGIKEKLDRINAFIAEGDNREAVRRELGTLSQARNGMYQQARGEEGEAAVMAALYDLYAPLPLVDDKITISPVEWTN